MDAAIPGQRQASPAAVPCGNAIELLENVSIDDVAVVTNTDVAQHSDVHVVTEKHDTAIAPQDMSSTGMHGVESVVNAVAVIASGA